MADKDADKWIISMLLAAISGILWWLLLDTRAEVTDLRTKYYEQAISIQSCKQQDQRPSVFHLKPSNQPE
jgi:hypothetical protein